MKKRIAMFVLAGLLVFSVSVSGLSGSEVSAEGVQAVELTTETEEAVTASEKTTTSEKAVSFTDVKSDSWYYPTVTAMAQKGAINGYPDGSFKPDADITVAEFTKICVSYLDGEQPAGTSWYSGYFDRARELGIANFSISSANADTPITRERMASMVDLCAEKILKEEAAATETTNAYFAKKFTDSAKIDSLFLNNVLSACARGFINGFETNGVSTFQPQGSATRAQAATMIVRLTDKGSRIAVNISDEQTSEKTVIAESGYCDDIGLPGTFHNKAYKKITAKEFLKMYPVDFVLYGKSSNYLLFQYSKLHFDKIGFFDTNGKQYSGSVTSQACGFPSVSLLKGTTTPTSNFAYWYFDPIGSDGLIDNNSTVLIVEDDLFNLMLEQVKSGKIPVLGNRTIDWN